MLKIINIIYCYILSQLNIVCSEIGSYGNEKKNSRLI